MQIKMQQLQMDNRTFS